MDRLHAFLTDQQPLHLPKGPMGKAISYILGNWKELTRFLEDARLPPDNNRSEAALRIVALAGRTFSTSVTRRPGKTSRVCTH